MTVKWTPTNTFSGTLDGNGFTIFSLRIDTSNSYVGLFSQINSATIRNLTMSNVQVRGTLRTGALAGAGSGTNLIENCSIQGIVSGRSDVGGVIGTLSGIGSRIENCDFVGEITNTGDSAGGIVGITDPITITQCNVQGTVKGADYVGGIAGAYGRKDNMEVGAGTIKNSGFSGNAIGHHIVGGIAGEIIQGTVLRCYNRADIQASGSNVAGIAGNTKNFSRIRESLSLGMVSGVDYVGGIVGYAGSDSIILDSYSRGEIKGAGSYTGGIVGSSVKSAVANSYASGNVTGKMKTGGLIGSLSNTENVITYSVSIHSKIRESAAAGRIYGEMLGTLNAASRNMAYENTVVQNNYQNLDVKVNNPAHHSKNGLNTAKSALLNRDTYILELLWDFDRVWTMPDARTDFPILRGIPENLQIPVTPLGTEENPYLIHNEKELSQITQLGLDRHYKLVDDIVIASRNWEPIGTATTPFTGVFDGNGCEIQGLTTDSTKNSVGLFGELWAAEVKDLGLIECDIWGNDKVGAIVGTSVGSTIIENCYVTGKVQGADYVGGMVGVVVSGGSIHSSSVLGSVSGKYRVGGIAASVVSGNIIQCFTKGSVKALETHVGGIVGAMGLDIGQVEQCFSTATVHGVDYVGGIAGGLGYPGSVIRNCYSTGEINGIGMYVGGVTGWLNNNALVTLSYATGEVTGAKDVGGIVGYLSGSNVTKSVALNSSISAVSGIRRVIGTSVNGSGYTARFSENMANSDMLVYINSVLVDVKGTNPTSATANGQNITKAQMYSTTLSLGWDYHTVWKKGATSTELPTLLGISETRKRPVVGVKLSASEKTVGVSDSFTLAAATVPANADNQNVSWQTSDSDIAIVDENGKVTAKAIGTVDVMVKTADGGFTATCTVNVTIPVTGVELSSSETTLSIGRSYQLDALVKPMNAINQEVTWQSSNPAVASVDESGNVTALTKGNVTITVKTAEGGFTASRTFNVVIPVSGIEISSTSESITIGYSVTLSAIVRPSDAANKNVLWKSSDPSVALVDNIGKVTGIQPGTAVITAMAEDGNLIQECVVTVLKLPENIAPGKLIMSSHVSGSNTAQKAIDENETTRWAAPSNTSDVTLMIDFNEMVSFEEIKLVEYDNRINDFILDYWDGTEWKVLHTGTTVGTDFSVDFQKVTGSRVRLFIVSTKGAYGASIAEFKVYDLKSLNNEIPSNPPDPSDETGACSEDLALNANAVASSVSGSNSAKKAVDGDSATRWGAQSNTTNVTFDIDFGKQVTFNQLKMNEYGDRIANYALQYWNGNDWIDIQSGTTMGEEFITDFDDVTTDKLRLLVVSTKGVYGASISDFEVYDVK